MEALGRYALSVVSAGMIAGVISSLAGKGTVRELLRILCGLFLTVSVLTPLLNLDMEELWKEAAHFRLEGQLASDKGQKMTTEALSKIIKAETEAYILDKAAQLDAVVSVEVSLSGDAVPVPRGMILQGQVSPYTRGKLEAILTEALGITKEELKWISQP